jgi:hypothetical protein
MSGMSSCVSICVPICVPIYVPIYVPCFYLCSYLSCVCLRDSDMSGMPIETQIGIQIKELEERIRDPPLGCVPICVPKPETGDHRVGRSVSRPPRSAPPQIVQARIIPPYVYVHIHIPPKCTHVCMYAYIVCMCTHNAHINAHVVYIHVFIHICICTHT